MGENFKRMRAESFTHLKDTALEEFTLPGLFANRPELRFASFNCESRNEGAQEGCDVSVVLGDDGVVQAWRCASVVGVVREPDATTIRDILRDHPAAWDMLTAVVDEYSPMTGDFCIRLAGADHGGTDD